MGFPHFDREAEWSKYQRVWIGATFQRTCPRKEFLQSSRRASSPQTFQKKTQQDLNNAYHRQENDGSVKRGREVPFKWSMNFCFNPISQWSLSIFIHIIHFQCLKQGQQPRLDQGTSDLAHQKDVAWWVLPGKQSQLPWQPPLVCCCHRWRWICWFLSNPKCCYHKSPTCCHNWGKRSWDTGYKEASLRRRTSPGTAENESTWWKILDKSCCARLQIHALV